ncbi:MAG TPA: AMP-binding protein [Acidimicrobiia bacterium]|jgi:acyl-CoA synthetase (AMP-forming)/AMP-acid ligase II
MVPDWQLRKVPEELVRRYRRERLWTDETLADLVWEGLTVHPELTFRVWSRQRPAHTTIGDLRERALQLAGGLEARGFGTGDVIAFQIPNWIEAAVTFYGVSLLGGVLVPVVHFYGPKELRHILRETGARALITADRFGHNDYLAGLASMRGDLPALELVAVVGDEVPGDTTAFGALLSGERIDRPRTPDPDAPAVVGYTSGTTANAKGVVHTHRTLVGEMHQVVEMNANPSAHPMMVGAPVGHAIGMQAGLLTPLVRGQSVHLTDVWDPATVLAAMLEADLTAGSGSTYFLQSLLDDPTCTPRHHELMGAIGLGGSAVPIAVAERAEALGITITRSYGSTEHPSTTGASHEEPRAKRNTTDGRALPGVEIRLVDEQGQEVGIGEPGEVWSRGPDLCVGYVDPSLTESVFDPEGWYASGDIGVLDADGYLAITDRKKDIIIRGGENISAAEVEELLLRMDGVAEVAVVAAPDVRLGEHVCAFVRSRPGATAPSVLDVRAHMEHAGLARQKWPEEVRDIDELPRTPSGKVKKFELRQRLRDESPDS